MQHLTDAILILMLLMGLLTGILKTVKPKLEQGDLEKIHEIDTIYKRLTKRIYKPKKNKFKRRTLWRKAQEKPAAVITFKGDLKASDRDDWARRADEVVENIDRLAVVFVHIESMGGVVTNYGLVYHHMVRIREACDRAGIELIACVGTGAASGGYLAALPAHRIMAPQFSIIGSIGVVLEFLNFHGLIERLGVEAVTITRGEQKRPLTQFARVTPEGRQHVEGQLEVVHAAFKDVVRRFRGDKVDIEATCTGDYWMAPLAKERGLIDGHDAYEDMLLAENKLRDLVFIGSKSNNPVAALAGRIAERSAAGAVSGLFAKMAEHSRIQL